MAIQPDSKIVVVGMASVSGTDTDPYVMRLLANPGRVPLTCYGISE